jgi:hypothetical protein
LFVASEQNKTSMNKLIITISFLCTSIFCFSQMRDYNIDSLMALRKLDSIDGPVKAYYSPGNKERAIKAQKLLEGAVSYYTQKYKKPFVVKLAMLDSAQWLYEIAPWGWNFFNNGWGIVNAGVSNEFFFEKAGLNEKSSEFENYLLQRKVALDQLMFANDMFTVVHEMGHYYIMKVRKIATSGVWFNEIGTDYLTYNYFEKINPNYFKQLSPFLHFMIENSSPQYREIIQWDTLMLKMPVDNFIWFDCQTQLLVQAIYEAKGEKFLDYFFKTFEGKTPDELGLEQVITTMDEYCGGVISKWRNQIRKQQ